MLSADTKIKDIKKIEKALLKISINILSTKLMFLKITNRENNIKHIHIMGTSLFNVFNNSWELEPFEPWCEALYNVTSGKFSKANKSASEAVVISPPVKNVKSL